MICDLGPQCGQDFRHAMVVDGHLRVRGATNVFALGDCAAEPQSLPQTAQVASQEVKWLGRTFNSLSETLQAQKDSDLRDDTTFDRVQPFHYKHRGSMAYVGSSTAVADLPSLD